MPSLLLPDPYCPEIDLGELGDHRSSASSSSAGFVPRSRFWVTTCVADGVYERVLLDAPAGSGLVRALSCQVMTCCPEELLSSSSLPGEEGFVPPCWAYCEAVNPDDPDGPPLLQRTQVKRHLKLHLLAARTTCEEVFYEFGEPGALPASIVVYVLQGGEVVDMTFDDGLGYWTGTHDVQVRICNDGVADTPPLGPGGGPGICCGGGHVETRTFDFQLRCTDAGFELDVRKSGVLGGLHLTSIGGAGDITSYSFGYPSWDLNPDLRIGFYDVAHYLVPA